MTDTRLPARWLTDRRLLQLSDAGHTLFVRALMYSVENRTDGVLLGTDLELVPKVDTSRAIELVEAGLWAYDGERWFIVDFDTTQTSKAQLEGLDHRRRVDRERQQRLREARKASRDDRVTNHATTTGQGQGQGTGAEGKEVTNDDVSRETWPDVAVPGRAYPWLQQIADEYRGAENNHVDAQGTPVGAENT